MTTGDEDMANGGSNGGGFSAGLLLGALIGVGAGLLLAPKSGAETRAALWEQTQGARERLPETLDSLQDRMEDLQADLARLGEMVRQRMPGSTGAPDMKDDNQAK